MRLDRVLTGIGVAALGAVALVVAPALQAQENHSLRLATARSAPRSVGIFTPAAADPKLAAVLSRSGLPESGFRFTPSSARSSNRSVMVAVRSRTSRGVAVADRAVVAPTVNVAPISYNLGVSVGWKRFALSGDVTRIELTSQPGSRERTDLGITYTGKRAAGRVTATEDRPLVNTPVLIGDKPSYSIDVGGSYSLSRNFDVTAGVRYKTERDRLDPAVTESRRDSQAVYVGTAFRF